MTIHTLPASAPVARARRRHAKLGALLVAFAVATTPGLALANYSCTGTVGYLGIDGGGDLTVSLQGVTPVHKICNVNAQGPFTGFTVAACKIAYATAVTAHVTGKTVTIYYNDQLSCATIVNWAETPSVYFVQGPD